MDFSSLKEPKVVTVKDARGESHEYIISKFGAIAGRKFALQYPIHNLMNGKDSGVSEQLMVELMSYVYKDVGGDSLIQLKTAALIDNHVPDALTLFKLEGLTLDHSLNFFEIVRNPATWAGLMQKVPQSVTQMLMPLLQSLFPKDSQPTKNLETN